MNIRYGTLEYNIDITEICKNELCINNVIYIPDGEHVRTIYFSDPIFGEFKSIFVFINNKMLTFDKTKKIYICLLENKVYSNKNIPNNIKEIFFEYLDDTEILDEKVKKFFNEDIQTSKLVINDIYKNLFNKNKKMLIFGLGYDSKMWYYITNKNVYFIEDNKKYIELNKDISLDNIIEYGYHNITVKKSFNLSEEEIDYYPIPQKLLELAPFDIIYIDGPEGCTKNSKGRLIPYYWAKKHLSKKGTIIYCDDCARLLESYCIHKFFRENKKKQISPDIPCMKVYV